MSKVGNVTVWINPLKRNDEDDKQPDYRGKVTIGEETHDLALWINGDIAGVVLNMSGQVTEER